MGLPFRSRRTVVEIAIGIFLLALILLSSEIPKLESCSDYSVGQVYNGGLIELSYRTVKVVPKDFEVIVFSENIGYLGKLSCK